MLNFPAEVHEHIGTVMARMHRLTENLGLARATYTPAVLLEEPFERLARFLDPETEEMRFMADAKKYLLRELAGADTRQLRRGAVHMDIWFDNLNVHGDRVTLFNFDFCGNGWLCTDIAYYLLQLHATEKDETERDLKAARFMKGYESVTPVSAEEKRLLPMLGVGMYFFYLGVQCSRYDDWSNQFLNTVYLKRFIMLLVKKYYDHHGLGTGNDRPGGTV